VDKGRPDHTTELFRLTAPLFLFLTSFRRKVRRGIRVELAEASDRLEEIFGQMGGESRQDPRLESLYEKVKFPLVVLADEILLHSGWEAAPQWEAQLLEEKYFSTNIGGEKYFSIANEIKPDDTELAAVLFTGITLGFGGKYRERPEKLSEVRKRLYRLNAEYIASLGDKITPAAYHVDPQPSRKLSPLLNLYRVLIVAFGVLVLYWILAFVLWGQSMGELREAARAMGL
jgi:type IV/VI secretion system ImpK/VasF family protein